MSSLSTITPLTAPWYAGFGIGCIAGVASIYSPYLVALTLNSIKIPISYSTTSAQSVLTAVQVLPLILLEDSPFFSGFKAGIVFWSVFWAIRVACPKELDDKNLTFSKIATIFVPTFLAYLCIGRVTALLTGVILAHKIMKPPLQVHHQELQCE